MDKLRLEKEAWNMGFQRIAGGDEAGRGPWAGPVVAAFAIMPSDRIVDGVDDSKKLPAGRRRELFEVITRTATAYGIGMASPEEIDRLNILQATRLAFMRALEALHPEPDFLLLDHITLSGAGIPSRSIPKGDAVSYMIGAASILAKETRDRIMEGLDSRHPGYGFANHKGYGTPEHQAALRKLGISPIHRRSFRPVKALSVDPQRKLEGMD